MTSGAVRAAGLPQDSRALPVGRPSWWLLAAALVVGCLVTIDLLTGGSLERLDLWVSEIVSDWGLADGICQSSSEDPVGSSLLNYNLSATIRRPAFLTATSNLAVSV